MSELSVLDLLSAIMPFLQTGTPNAWFRGCSTGLVRFHFGVNGRDEEDASAIGEAVKGGLLEGNTLSIELRGLGIFGRDSRPERLRQRFMKRFVVGFEQDNGGWRHCFLFAKSGFYSSACRVVVGRLGATV